MGIRERFSARVVFLNPEVGIFARAAGEGQKKPPRNLINPRAESSLSAGRILLFILERAERGLIILVRKMTDTFEADARLLGRGQQLICVNEEAQQRSFR